MQVTLLIPIVFYVLSGICDAVMDTCSHHFSTSIFKTKDPWFWDTSISWKSKYVNHDPSQGLVKWNVLGFSVVKPVQLSDSFHFFKMLREIFNVAAISAAAWCGFHSSLFWLAVFFVATGTIRNFFFSLFYDKVLRA